MRIPLSLAGDCAAVCLRDDVIDRLQLLLSAELEIDEMPDAVHDSIDVSATLDASAAVIWTGRQASINRSDWFCHIDVVSMQADMRDVHLRQWPLNDVTEDETAELHGTIEGCLASDPDARLRRWALHPCSPSQWIVHAAASDRIDVNVEHPRGLLDAPLRHHRASGADSRLWQRLTTELQMMMHASTTNTARLQQGRMPVNGVWLYGAGLMPSVSRAKTLPSLRGHDDWACGLWQLLAGEPSIPIEDEGMLLQGGVVHAPLPPGTLAERIEQTLVSGVVREVRLLMPARTLRVRRQRWLRRLTRRWGGRRGSRVND
ncbi:MAG: hypothetical protein AAGJ86_08190 [Pseudomonadota bacterium]